jgi:excisionase family DNA binding protein
MRRLRRCSVTGETVRAVPRRRRQEVASADRLLDVQEAADMLSIKVPTLYQWAYQRRIAVVKLNGRALRFRLSEIERLIAQGDRPALRDSA